MNSTHNISKVYHGKWRIPKHNQSGEVEYKECMGTLIYDGEDIKLNVYPDFSIPPFQCEYIDVMYGCANGGYEFTLFGLILTNINFGVSATFSIKEVISGRKVESLSAPVYDECVVKYPYLRDWINTRLLKITDKEKLKLEAPLYNLPSILDIQLDSGDTLSFRHHNSYKSQQFQFIYEEDVAIRIVSNSLTSINHFKEVITKFTQFLSVALYGKQSPCSIKLRSTIDDEEADELLFRKTKSCEPSHIHLIKFNLLKDRMKEFVNNWFRGYDQVAPICGYLIRSLEESIFDAPKFLIVAQAIDGYAERFADNLNKPKNTNYTGNITLLLERFEEIDALQKCDIDANVIAQTRNKYSHLLPDDTKKHKKAVSGRELFLLTKKTMVLLTCCILDYMGMTANDINACIKGSIVERMI